MHTQLLALALALTCINASATDWTGLKREKIQLKQPLLMIRAPKGFIACGYINVEACNITGEACAIGRGQVHQDLLDNEIKAVSSAAAALGIKVGMKGAEALELLK
jgi:uncharacterized protein YunC (DUF1805 family)